MSNSNYFYQLQDADGKITKDLAEAIYLLIGPNAKQPSITVGNRGGDDRVKGAVYMAMAMYRFCDFSYPQTSFPEGVHCHYNVANEPYVENAGTVLVNGQWWEADWRVNRMVPSRLLDATNHANQIKANLQAKGVSPEKIARAITKEYDRANGDAARIAKAEWGEFFGFTFKVKIPAYLSEWLKTMYAQLEEKNFEKAVELRRVAMQEAGQRKREYRAFAGMAQDIDTDTPDTPEEKASLVFPRTDGARILGSIDLFSLPAETPFSIYWMDGKRLSRTSKTRRWDPTNQLLVAELEAKNTGKYAVLCAG